MNFIRILLLSQLLLLSPLLHAMVNSYFQRIDTNQSGFIDEDEHNNATLMIFQHIDVDDDGLMSSQELSSNAIGIRMLEKEQLLKKDVDNDGKISQLEFQALRMYQFRMADVDQDQRISSDEMLIFYKYQAFSNMDSNADSCISPKEFVGFQFGKTKYSH